MACCDAPLFAQWMLWNKQYQAQLLGITVAVSQSPMLTAYF